MRLIRRFQPSTVIATVALFVALGGTSYAVSGQINGSQLKNGSVTGKKLAKHTVTGTQVNVATFPKVPSAHLADSATTATGLASSATIAGSQVTGAVANATNAATATNATNATNATTAAKLSGESFAQINGSCPNSGAGNCASTDVTILNGFNGLTLGLGCEGNGSVDIDATSATPTASYGSSSTTSGNLSNFFGTQGAFGTQTITNPNEQSAVMTFTYTRTVNSITDDVTGTLTVYPGPTCGAWGRVEDTSGPASS